MLYNVPIESFEERYSTQWNLWFPEVFQGLGIDYETVYGDMLINEIRDGSFLDVCGTNYFKASQLMRLVKLLFEKKVQAGDVIFFHDLWFPGIEMLQYIRQGLGVDFKIAGILHAGTYDPFDFLSKQGMAFWGKPLEESWFSFFDKIFVATDFHKKLIISERSVDSEKVFVTGLPIYFDASMYSGLKTKKEKIVVFPHRLDSEKNPHLFNKLAGNFKGSDWQFIKTKEVCKTKKAYYEMLRRSKIAVSFAEQETWGIAQQEAAFHNCLPVVPDRLSYQELYDKEFKFDSFQEAVALVEKFMIPTGEVVEKFFQNREFLLKKGSQAIAKICYYL